MFVIWPYCGARAISHNSVMVKLLARVRKVPGPPESAALVIFGRDRFLSSSFGLTEVPVRFRVIP